MRWRRSGLVSHVCHSRQREFSMALRRRDCALKLLICGTKKQSLGVGGGGGGGRRRVVFGGKIHAAVARSPAGCRGAQERAAQRRRDACSAVARGPLGAARRAVPIERGAGARGAKAQ